MRGGGGRGQGGGSLSIVWACFNVYQYSINNHADTLRGDLATSNKAF